MATTNSNITQIPAPRVPLLNAQTGAVSMEWFLWFNNVYTITGSGIGITPVINGGTGIGTIPANGQFLIGNGTGYTLQTNLPITSGGTGASTAAGARANLDVAQAIYSVPAGGIIIWSGSQASIPTGWLLCNGSSGTPDLRDRFVVGAGSTYAVAATGGSSNAVLVSHTHTDSGHTHTIPTVNSASNGADAIGTTAAAANSTRTSNSNSPLGLSTEGVSGTNANLPPYYALCYIMKS